MPRSIPAYAHKAWLEYVTERARDDLDARALLEALPDKRAKAKRIKERGPRSTPRPQEGPTKAEHRRDVYAAVDARSHGCCESCWVETHTQIPGVSRDHFWGRAREESVESVWRLCATCDHDKTNNRPNRKWWLGRFRRHAMLHGYAEQAEKVDRAVALEIAQHPEKKP